MVARTRTQRPISSPHLRGSRRYVCVCVCVKRKGEKGFAFLVKEEGSGPLFHFILHDNDTHSMGEGKRPEKGMENIHRGIYHGSMDDREWEGAPNSPAHFCFMILEQDGQWVIDQGIKVMD